MISLSSAFIIMQDEMAEDLGYDTENPLTKRLVTQDYLKVNVFYQTLNVKQIMEDPKYPV